MPSRLNNQSRNSANSLRKKLNVADRPPLYFEKMRDNRDKIKLVVVETFIRLDHHPKVQPNLTCAESLRSARQGNSSKICNEIRNKFFFL